ncbi:MAG: CNNM domain-containing protein [Burkholderiaceae bacterium]
MDSLPLWVQALALICLLALSAFFSIAETSMMALNRYRLGHLVRQGVRGARLAAKLLGRTEKLLGAVLLGNNLVNTALTAIVTSLAIRQFGNDDTVLLVATAVVAFLIIVFCEITPKVIGATYPERIALPSSFVLDLVTRVASPAIWFVNLISGRLLKLMGVRTNDPDAGALSLDELRTIVLESGAFMPDKHRSILLNLFDLNHITVDDVMTPRHRIEALDVGTDERGVREQLTTCFHNKLPVCEGEINQVIGILHVRRALSLLQRDSFTAEDLRELLAEPYFLPSGTPVFTQLQFFQENRQRLGLVVDEYGEVLGLVTLEDIIEEIIGEFTTSTPGGATLRGWGDDGEVVVEGTTTLRELNRRFDARLPLDGPRTIGGLIIERLQDLPDGNVSMRFGHVAAEVTQMKGPTIRSVRLRRLGPPPGGDGRFDSRGG